MTLNEFIASSKGKYRRIIRPAITEGWVSGVVLRSGRFVKHNNIELSALEATPRLAVEKLEAIFESAEKGTTNE